MALGDWHGRKQIGPRTWYSGTPEPDAFQDNDPGHALIVALGLGVAAFQFLNVDVAPPLLLGGYFVLAVAAFGISYLFAKKTSA